MGQQLTSALELLFQNAPDPVCVVDAQFDLQWFNNKTAEQYMYQVSAWISESDSVDEPLIPMDGQYTFQNDEGEQIVCMMSQLGLADQHYFLLRFRKITGSEPMTSSAARMLMVTQSEMLRKVGGYIRYICENKTYIPNWEEEVRLNCAQIARHGVLLHEISWYEAIDRESLRFMYIKDGRRMLRNFISTMQKATTGLLDIHEGTIESVPNVNMDEGRLTGALLCVFIHAQEGRTDRTSMTLSASRSNGRLVIDMLFRAGKPRQAQQYLHPIPTSNNPLLTEATVIRAFCRLFDGEWSEFLKKDGYHAQLSFTMTGVMNDPPQILANANPHEVSCAKLWDPLLSGIADPAALTEIGSLFRL